MFSSKSSHLLKKLIVRVSKYGFLFPTRIKGKNYFCIIFKILAFGGPF